MSAQPFCTNCGTARVTDAKFCGGCGTPAGPTASQQVKAPTPISEQLSTPNNSPRGVSILFYLVYVGIILTVLSYTNWWYYNHNNQIIKSVTQLKSSTSRLSRSSPTFTLEDCRSFGDGLTTGNINRESSLIYLYASDFNTVYLTPLLGSVVLLVAFGSLCLSHARLNRYVRYSQASPPPS
jgi:hypothetical protein